MPNLHTTLEPGDVVLIPAGAGAAIQVLAKSGKRSRVAINCDAPITITRAQDGRSSPSTASPPVRVARRPSTG